MILTEKVYLFGMFFQAKGKIKDNQLSNIACDFYNKYHDDIAIIKKLNIPNFRFSISC